VSGERGPGHQGSSFSSGLLQPRSIGAARCQAGRLAPRRAGRLRPASQHHAGSMNRPEFSAGSDLGSSTGARRRSNDSPNDAPPLGLGSYSVLTGDEQSPPPQAGAGSCRVFHTGYGVAVSRDARSRSRFPGYGRAALVQGWRPCR